MIAAISPADINYDETLSTLRYADRVKQIKNKATVNEDPMESLIRQLKEENERLKESLKSTDLPSTIVTVGMSPAEVEKLKIKMRQELMEQMRANMEELEAQNQAVFQDKLNQARKEAAEQAEAALSKSGVASEVHRTKPYLSNLNEDPQLSGVIIHPLVHKQTGIGRKPPDIETTGSTDNKQSRIYWIKMQGLCMADEHALLIRHGKTGAEVELRVFPTASQMTKVNGIAIKKSVTLQHKDRVLFGSHQLYVFYSPLSEQAVKEKKEGKDLEPIDWEFAQRELAQATGFEQLDIRPGKKEDAIIQQQLLELLPMVSEVNAIAEELEKNRSFELLLIPPTAQSLKFGELKMTKVAIRMKDLVEGSTWLWDSGKFKDRRYLMQEMYQNFLEKGSAECSNEKDPFWEPLEDCIVGSAPAFLQALVYRLDVDDELKITSFEGTEVGTLEVKLIPCARSGKTLAELDISGTGMLDFVEDATELLGKPYHFKVIITSLKLFGPLENAKATISYRIFKENEPTTCVVSPNTKHSRIFSIDQLTPEHLDYFNTDFIGFIVHCSQTRDNTMSRGYSNKLSPENASPMMMRRTRRYSRVTVEELSDVSRLKTDLVLLQRTLDRFYSKDKKMKEVYNLWANKEPSKENYQALLDDMNNLNNININVSFISNQRGKLSPSDCVPEEDETSDQSESSDDDKQILSQSKPTTDVQNNQKQTRHDPNGDKKTKKTKT